MASEEQVSENEGVNLYRVSERLKPLIKKAVTELLQGEKSIQLLIKEIPFSEVLKEFKKEFYYIEAAGGFIQKNDAYLFIHRHGRWDLPKGKLEKKEGIVEAAIRECEEECGVKELGILKQLESTFHIYEYKKSFALKQSYWFHMRSSYEGELVPQTGESIDQAKWFTLPTIKTEILPDTYFTIQDVVKQGLNLG